MSSLSYAPVKPNVAGAACFTTTDPHYSKTGSPARMADGRIVTDYRPRCAQYPTAAAQAWGDNEARLRMIHGADELMAAARAMNNRKATAVSCVDTMVPELYKRVCTWQGCKTIPGNFQGIGTGRIYIPSAAAAADKPQQLSDLSVPQIPLTFPREAPRIGSKCAIDDPETAWTVKGDTSIYGGSAKSHPYSAPRE
jgi:hypothetical protein